MVVMACDGALRFLEAADAARAAENQDAAVLNVEKAQRVLLEMMGALDHAVAPAMTETLERLYQSLLDRLSDALHGDRKAITETRLVLTRLRNAWLEAGGRCRVAGGR
jgi:flagellar biosynthetic protein FliS